MLVLGAGLGRLAFAMPWRGSSARGASLASTILHVVCQQLYPEQVPVSGLFQDPAIHPLCKLTS